MIMKLSICKRLFFEKVMLACFLGLFLVAGAVATPADGIFELETDANFNDDSTQGDDWGTPPLSGAAKVYTAIDDTSLPDTIFAGGMKNIFDLPELKWVNGSILDKGNILHAYAAAYIIDENLILNFAALRKGTNGDAFMGFWFYQDDVYSKADGTFAGEHFNGDILIQVNYLQSANLGPEILVLQWDSSCIKRLINKKGGEGDCLALNLRLVKQANALCVPGTNQLMCASTNTTVDSVDGFPIESFFEGGINLTDVLNNPVCFSAFSAETRASSSITAQLKDFAMDSFELCSVDVTKVCAQGRVNAAEDGYLYDFSGDVLNNGVGTLYNVIVIDSEDAAYQYDLANDTNTYTPISVAAALLPGASAPYSGTIESTSFGLGNTVIVKAAPVDTVGAEKTVTDTATATCQSPSLTADIAVNKECSSTFIPDYESSGVIAIGVGFSGQVCNDHDELTMVLTTLVDNKATVYLDEAMTEPFTEDIELAVNECISYYGEYIPSSFDNATEQSFTDTVIVAGHLKVNPDLTDEAVASAECAICVP